MKLFMRNVLNTEKRVRLHHRYAMPMMMTMIMMAMLRVADASAEATNATCKHATNMWGDPNPNIFYVCSVADQMPLQLHCPQGRGFFNGHGHLGCLPYDQWPACRPTVEPASSCNGNGSAAHAKDQPWATLDPNRFYMCPGVNAAPLLLDCTSGKGFVQTAKTRGCADWSHWRREMQCEAYY
ncbi:uncharacterized protein LOC6575101 [Drosophila mojavensis]|uniref:Chitin-binding type-2 domain-containing protein n=1 Tax=Drosophila mojavensis TaxID=7230 RepID=B4K8Y3_DROMO|nr:uncharacterized protein LOC6575101 [Drosophila mojavensis]EDW16580.2 uncharacterized protein Dmoj_GI22145 [Drosophila mojavensis]